MGKLQRVIPQLLTQSPEQCLLSLRSVLQASLDDESTLSAALMAKWMQYLEQCQEDPHHAQMCAALQVVQHILPHNNVTRFKRPLQAHITKAWTHACQSLLRAPGNTAAGSAMVAVELLYTVQSLIEVDPKAKQACATLLFPALSTVILHGRHVAMQVRLVAADTANQLVARCRPAAALFRDCCCRASGTKEGNVVDADKEEPLTHVLRLIASSPTFLMQSILLELLYRLWRRDVVSAMSSVFQQGSVELSQKWAAICTPTFAWSARAFINCVNRHNGGSRLVWSWNVASLELNHDEAHGSASTVWLDFGRTHFGIRVHSRRSKATLTNQMAATYAKVVRLNVDRQNDASLRIVLHLQGGNVDSLECEIQRVSFVLSRRDVAAWQSYVAPRIRAWVAGLPAPHAKASIAKVYQGGPAPPPVAPTTTASLSPVPHETAVAPDSTLASPELGNVAPVVATSPEANAPHHHAPDLATPHSHQQKWPFLPTPSPMVPDNGVIRPFHVAHHRSDRVEHSLSHSSRHTSQTNDEDDADGCDGAHRVQADARERVLSPTNALWSPSPVRGKRSRPLDGTPVEPMARGHRKASRRSRSRHKKQRTSHSLASSSTGLESNVSMMDPRTFGGPSSFGSHVSASLRRELHASLKRLKDTAHQVVEKSKVDLGNERQVYQERLQRLTRTVSNKADAVHATVAEADKRLREAHARFRREARLHEETCDKALSTMQRLQMDSVANLQRLTTAHHRRTSQLSKGQSAAMLDLKRKISHLKQQEATMDGMESWFKALQTGAEE